MRPFVLASGSQFRRDSFLGGGNFRGGVAACFFHQRGTFIEELLAGSFLFGVNAAARLA